MISFQDPYFMHECPEAAKQSTTVWVTQTRCYSLEVQAQGAVRAGPSQTSPFLPFHGSVGVGPPRQPHFNRVIFLKVQDPLFHYG